MLTTLFPRAFQKYSGLPLLGPIEDSFDDWLLERGYTVTSRTYAIEMLRHIDKDLRRRGIERVTSLTYWQSTWHVRDLAFPASQKSACIRTVCATVPPSQC